jgi:DNA (cytosine-5)-methyltransferase 1
MSSLNVLDLFSGIGGFSLGLEKAGMRTVAFCEIDGYARSVLAKHWPGVPCYVDIRTLTADRLRTDGIAVDVICGGFPCQDISTAGRGAGIGGERSGLWKEYARLIGELRPRYVVVENVSALLSRGLDVVLGDLAALGYDAEWHCIPASAVGAPHRRDRLWIVAQPTYNGPQNKCGAAIITSEKITAAWRTNRSFPHADIEGLEGRIFGKIAGEKTQVAFARRHQDVADTAGVRQPGSGESEQWGNQATDRERETDNAFPVCVRGQWGVEPDVGRVAYGVPARVDRLRCLGNAVVPQIPEIIGRAIMNAQLR